MAYSSGILDKRVTILNKVKPEDAGFGETTQYEAIGSVWANVTWSKGTKALREGALDAYDTVLIRTRFTCEITRDSLLECDGVRYQILSLHTDKRENICQIKAQEVVNG